MYYVLHPVSKAYYKNGKVGLTLHFLLTLFATTSKLLVREFVISSTFACLSQLIEQAKKFIVVIRHNWSNSVGIVDVLTTIGTASVCLSHSPQLVEFSWHRSRVYCLPQLVNELPISIIHHNWWNSTRAVYLLTTIGQASA